MERFIQIVNGIVQTAIVGNLDVIAARPGQWIASQSIGIGATYNSDTNEFTPVAEVGVPLDLNKVRLPTVVEQILASPKDLAALKQALGL